MHHMPGRAVLRAQRQRHWLVKRGTVRSDYGHCNDLLAWTTYLASADLRVADRRQHTRLLRRDLNLWRLYDEAVGLFNAVDNCGCRQDAGLREIHVAKDFGTRALHHGLTVSSRSRAHVHEMTRIGTVCDLIFSGVAFNWIVTQVPGGGRAMTPGEVSVRELVRLITAERGVIEKVCSPEYDQQSLLPHS